MNCFRKVKKANSLSKTFAKNPSVATYESMKYIKLFLAIITLAAKPVLAEEKCDVLGSLEADPMAVAKPVDFSDIEALALIAACDSALKSGSKYEGRHILQRARGYLRLGESTKAITEIERSHKIGYPAATFALATAYFLGDDVPQDYLKAETLFLQAYNKGVIWAARGLASIYSDELSDLFDEKKASEWTLKFDVQIEKD